MTAAVSAAVTPLQWAAQGAGLTLAVGAAGVAGAGGAGGPLSDSMVTALGAVAVACVSLLTVFINHRATQRLAREGRVERRRDRVLRQRSQTHAETAKERDEWRERFYGEYEKRIRVEARLERVIERNALPPDAGRSGEYPPFDPRGPLPPSVLRDLHRSTDAD